MLGFIFILGGDQDDWSRSCSRPLGPPAGRSLPLSYTISQRYKPPCLSPCFSVSSFSVSIFRVISVSVPVPLSLSFSLSFAFSPPLSLFVYVPLSCSRSLARLAPRSRSRFRLCSWPCLRSRACFICVCLVSALSLSSQLHVLSLFVLFVPSCPFSLSLALTCLDQWLGLQRWCPCARTTCERKNKLTGERINLWLFRVWFHNSPTKVTSPRSHAPTLFFMKKIDVK